MKFDVKLPSRAELTRQLRALNEAYGHPEGGPEYVCLYYQPNSTLVWRVAAAGAEEDFRLRVGWELVPGTDRFDVTRAARRLLSSLRLQLVALRDLRQAGRAFELGR